MVAADGVLDLGAEGEAEVVRAEIIDRAESALVQIDIDAIGRLGHVDGVMAARVPDRANAVREIREGVDIVARRRRGIGAVVVLKRRDVVEHVGGWLFQPHRFMPEPGHDGELPGFLAVGQDGVSHAKGVTDLVGERLVCGGAGLEIRIGETVVEPDVAHGVADPVIARKEREPAGADIGDAEDDLGLFDRGFDEAEMGEAVDLPENVPCHGLLGFGEGLKVHIHAAVGVVVVGRRISEGVSDGDRGAIGFAVIQAVPVADQQGIDVVRGFFRRRNHLGLGRGHIEMDPGVRYFPRTVGDGIEEMIMSGVAVGAGVAEGTVG